MAKEAWSTGKVQTELRHMFPTDSYALFWEVRNKTGFTTGGKERYADALAMSLWPSRGLDIIGFEIKVSRGDWQKELRDPAKSEAIMQYCDKWYLVVGNKDIVKKGELPPTWGLIAPKRSRLGIITSAPTLSPRSISKSFLASILRKAQGTQQTVAHELVAAAVKNEIELRVKHLKTNSDRWKKQYEKLQEKVHVFEANAGLQITSWGASSPELLGKLVNFVQGKGALVIARDARILKSKIDGIVEAADEVLDACKEVDYDILEE